MSKRFYYDEFLEEIYDEQIGDYPSNQSICEILNQQSQRIAELEEQLKGCIRPKFKIGQEVYLIDDYYSIVPFEIDKILITENGVEIKSVEWNEWFEENDCFITREEAQAKLQELQGESK